MPSGGTVYYEGDNHWNELFDKRKLYDTEAAAKAEPFIYKWENASIINEG